jgi:hyperosmotically inducible protein
MLPLYGTSVSRYAEICLMTLNNWNCGMGIAFRFLACVSLCMVVSTLVFARPCRSAVPDKAVGGQSAKAEDKNSSSLGREVRHQLAELPFYSEFDFITFTLDGKKVTLSGQVVRPSLKKHAVTAIQSLEGVEKVVDQIEVLPRSPEDNEIRRTIYRSIYEDPTLATYAVQAVPAIHIIVKNGSVALEGMVKSAVHKNLAGARAGSVENVATVTNNLKVQASPSAPE